MKTTKYIIVAVVGALLTLTSCINDLETLPMNDWDKTSETAYGKSRQAYVQGLAKLYFNFTTNDTTDLLVSDAGASELIRSFWSCQEVSTDEAKCAWPDAWCTAINTTAWNDSENDMVYGVFVRTLQGVAYVNEYLRQTAPEKLDARGVDAELKKEIEGFRAEARFLRAYFYWMAMDVFGDVPFTTEDSPFGSVYPKQKPRAEIYKFIVDELTELAGDDSAMPAAKSNRPRADKGSVLGLLARVYLNAEVYTGTAAWTECKATCEKIFTLGYSLCQTYEHLFRGDNGENQNAYNEFLFYANYDETSAKSWGGGSFLTCGAAGPTDLLGDTRIPHLDKDGQLQIKKDTIKYSEDAYLPERGHDIIYDADGKPEKIARADTTYKKESRLGAGNGWLGLHVHEHFVINHFDPQDVTWGEDGTCTIADKRGYAFFTARRTEGSFTKNDGEDNFYKGYGCWKFNNIPSYENGIEYWERTGNPDKNTNIDYPLIRLGEIYLAYAEACCRLGNGGEAQNKMNELANRTGVAAFEVPASWNDDAMVAFREERARELYWEGHRRTDLIRYNSFVDNYAWPFKSNDAEGKTKTMEPHKVVFAIPSSQILANPELKNPAGY